ncbi:MAG: hypothetical protein IKT51_02740 [Phascolarctobacterium sp.]|nr:hypothetical protein [Phascolarctobacterium sp.]
MKMSQDKYTVEEVRGYLAVILSLAEMEKKVSQREAITTMKLFNTLQALMDNEQTREALVEIKKHLDANLEPKDFIAKCGNMMDRVFRAFKF